MKIVLIAFSLFLSVNSFALPIGGTVVEKKDELFKRAVLLLSVTLNGEIEVCGGTPISKDVIITAAHCAYRATEPRLFSTMLFAYFGGNLEDLINDIPKYGNDFMNCPGIVKVKDIKLHEKYKFKASGDSDVIGAYDIALVQLEQKIPKDYLISSLYNLNESISKYEVLGYGENEWKQGTGTGTLQKNSYVPSDLIVSDKQDLKFYRNSHMCHGDSGGPTFALVKNELKLIGIHSNGTGCSRDEVNGVDKYTPFFKDWINQTMAALK